MQSLPNNCRCGKIQVHPDGWKAGGKSLLKERWYIKYRFYDDNTGQSKQVMIARFNAYDNIEDRKKAVTLELKRLDYELKELGYNPLSNSTQKPVTEPDNPDINKFTSFIAALKFAKTMLKISDNTMKSETEWVLRQLEVAAKSLHLDKVAVWNITLKHLYLICEKAAYKADNSYSGDKFNRNKKVLRQLYKKLLILEVVQANYPLSLERQKGAAKKKKVVLSREERKKLIEYLEKKSPRFLLFIQIFFHSGARLTEVLRLQVKDVDIKSGQCSYLVMKGRQYTHKERPIKDIAVGYWLEAIKGARKTDYVFSDNLCSGLEMISTNTIKQRWKRLQEKLGLKASFYSLKHLNTTETTRLIGIRGAAMQNAESEEMIKRHYDVDAESEEMKIIKKVNNPL